MIENILLGFELLLQPESLMYLTVGLLAGFVVGVLPGFDAANAAAIALPFSILLAPEGALLLMVGIYAGSQFAGAIPAVLMNVPGTPGAAATALDGYPLALQGKGALAIGVARMSSAVGGMLSAVLVILVMGPMAALSQSFRSPEMFLVALTGLLIIGSVIGNDLRKGLLSALLGMLVAAMSASPMTAEPRFTMGFLELYDEVPFVPVVIGMFGFCQMFILAMEHNKKTKLLSATPLNDQKQDKKRNILGTLSAEFHEAWRGVKVSLRYPKTMLRSSAIGSAIGVIPGMGTTVANFLSYAQAKKSSKQPEKFGKGTPEGIVASESTDSSVAAGTLVPTLALGVPGSATGAIMLAALYLQGVQPGPNLMVSHAGETYAVLLGMFVACLLILPLGTILAAPLAQITRVPNAVLVPLVLIIALVGAYAVRNYVFDIVIALLVGIIAVFMRRYSYPVVPFVLGLILGPIAEINFMRALNLSNNDPSVFFQTPTAWVLWSIIAIGMFLTVRSSIKSRSETRSKSQDERVKV